MGEIKFDDWRAEAERFVKGIYWQHRDPDPRTDTSVLWSVIGMYCSHGSGYSYQLCREFGLDPNEKVRTHPRRLGR